MRQNEDVLSASIKAEKYSEKSANKSALEEIIEKRRLYSYQQTIQNIKYGKQCGVELLIRGPKDTPLHRPDQLFATAQRYELDKELEILALKIHLTNIKRFASTDFYTINLSPAMLLDEEVIEILLHFEFANIVKIELTEHLPIEDWLPILQQMTQLRVKGYEFWLDDVGCGYFDLAMIEEVNPEVVKLCISIVSRLPHDDSLFEKIKTVVKTVHYYGGLVLAEGVEEIEQLLIAKALGIDLAQGYLFDKPVLIEK
ncbi:EAL domain-containing protein [Vibrio atypicus]|uniref:EAL domain-containing protein n=1 Tax=Vibrio atypicus TaxID=558271 RepID=UPI00135A5E9C|nr:EAL domain-containing protein [Vibrio atypicus]